MVWRKVVWESFRGMFELCFGWWEDFFGFGVGGLGRGFYVKV